MQNADLFVMTYGAFVVQLIKDYKDINIVNAELHKMYAYKPLMSRVLSRQAHTARFHWRFNVYAQNLYLFLLRFPEIMLVYIRNLANYVFLQTCHHFFCVASLHATGATTWASA